MPVRPKTVLESIRWLHKEKMTLYLVLFLALVFALWSVLVAPLLRTVKTIQKELAEKKLQLIGTEEAMKHIRNPEELLAERRAELVKLDARVLKAGQESRMIETFTDAAQSLPITIVSVQPEPEPPITAREPEDTTPWRKEGFRKSKISVNLQCRFQSLASLLERLNESDLFFEVEALDVKTQEGQAPNLDIRLVLSAYAEGKI